MTIFVRKQETCGYRQRKHTKEMEDGEKSTVSCYHSSTVMAFGMQLRLYTFSMLLKHYCSACADLGACAEGFQSCESGKQNLGMTFS